MLGWKTLNHSIIKKILLIGAVLVLGLSLLCLLLFWLGRPQKTISWGYTFSSIRATELGYTPQALLARTLDDLHPAIVRIPAYWSEIEPQQNQYNFQTIENLLTETDKRNIPVIVVIGKKQPRWPECHQPDWYNSLSADKQHEALISMLQKSVEQLKHHQSVYAWQIENEPFFDYGPSCPTTSKSTYEDEIKAVLQQDTKPIIATDSGEKGMWLTASSTGANILGATMYREVYHDKKRKYITYPIPWWVYNIKAGLVKLFTGGNPTIGVELQAEPWLKLANPHATPPTEQLQHMNPEIFQRNIEYAQKVGFSQNLLWGVEWWYWMADQQNNASMLNTAKTFFNSINK